jgi:hypothetical protein
MRHLPLRRLHLNNRIHQAGGSNDLLGDGAAGFFELVFAGGGGDEDDLVPHLLEFFDAEGAVVEGAGEAKAMLDEGFLALAVAVVHGLELGDGDVGFVDDEEVVLGEIVDQSVGLFAGFSAVEMARVVFDAGADPDFQQ